MVTLSILKLVLLVLLACSLGAVITLLAIHRKIVSFIQKM